MGRLIDADSLKDRASEYTLNNDEYRRFCEIIDAQPTAYDLDKVVEQLEEKTELAYRRYMDCPRNSPCYERYQTQYTQRKMCLELVKCGGVEKKSECEWKLEDSESNLYVTECENRQLIFEGTPEENGYKYCPYCGRKIKRGGVDG